MQGIIGSNFQKLPQEESSLEIERWATDNRICDRSCANNCQTTRNQLCVALLEFTRFAADRIGVPQRTIYEDCDQ
jgi:hypothetical protein